MSLVPRLCVAFVGVALLGAASAEARTYSYRLKIDAVASGDNFVPRDGLYASGSLSASWTGTWSVHFMVDDAARTVQVTVPNYGWAEVAVTNSMSETAGDGGDPDYDYTCSFADARMNPFLTLGDEGSSSAYYESGTVPFRVYNVFSDDPWGQWRVYRCDGSPERFVGPSDLSVPGIGACRGPISIPLSRLGERHFVLQSDPGPIAGCADPLGHGTYTGHIAYTLTLDLLSTPVRITGATLDFAARARRRAGKLRDQVVKLAGRKEKLEGEILAEKEKAEKAIKGIGRLQPDIERVQDAIHDTLDALERLKRAEGAAPGELRGLLEAEERYSAEVGSLERRIVAAEQQGEDATKLRRELRTARDQLDAVEHVLKMRLRETELGELRAKWLERLRTLANRSFDLLDEHAKLLARQGAAEAKLTADANELRDVDAKLFDIGQRLTRFDPEIHEITASVGGKTVFHASAAYSYADLLEINEQIAAHKPVLDRIQAGKATAFADFKAAQKDAIASQKHLAELLYKLAYGRFATDLVFDAYDVVKATAKGGVVGAVAELGKKLIEKGLKVLAGEPGSGIEPGSIEEQINKEFKAGLKDAYSKPQIVRTVAERVLKDTLTKATKDTANQYLGQKVFEKVEYKFRFKLEVEPHLVPGTPRDYAKAEKALKRLTKQLESLRKGYLGNFTGKPELKKFFQGEAENFAKDALKTIIKGQLDRLEREAWRDFVIKDAIARTFYGPYHSYADLWENALTRMDGLLAAKAKLLRGGKEGELTSDVSEQFLQNAQVQIDLKLGGHRDPDDPVEVLVNGVEATRNTDDSYTISADSVTPGPDGTLAITLR